MTWEIERIAAGKVAREAFEAQRTGKNVQARTLYARAARLERRALELLNPEKKRCTSIAVINVAQLLRKAGLIDEMASFIQSKLSAHGRDEITLTSFAVEILTGMIDSVVEKDLLPQKHERSIKEILNEIDRIREAQNKEVRRIYERIEK